MMVGTKTYYKKKLKKLFSLYIRQRGECEAKEISKCGGNLQCSHIKTTKAYPNLAYDPFNALCLCYRHHIYWWHKEPTEVTDWFRTKFPERWKYLEENKNKLFHPNAQDLKELCKFYEKKTKEGGMPFII